MNKKVLVVGESSFIGRSIADEFLRCNDEVYVLNRGDIEPWDARIKQIVCDRDNGSMLKEVLYGLEFDIVIDVCGMDSKQAERLCEALDREKIETFVYISSSAVYDVKSLRIPYRETDELGENPYRWNYGEDKIKAEFYYKGQFIWTNTKLIIIRPPYVYGEGNYAQSESFIFKHVQEHRPVIIPASNPRLQFIYVNDLADFVYCAAKNVRDNINVFNVGNKESMTAKEWVNECAKAAGGHADIIEYDYEPTGRGVREFFPFYDYDNVLDVSKMKSVYKRETDFAEGLKKSYEWYLENAGMIEQGKDIELNEKQILDEMETARKKAEYNSVIRTADSEDAEIEKWFKSQINGRDDDLSESRQENNENPVVITKDKSLMPVLDIMELISGNTSVKYTSGKAAAAIENSECYAVFYEEDIIGFARVITDKAAAGLICDFVISESYRNKGYGQMLLEYIKSDSVLDGIRLTAAATGDSAFLKKRGFKEQPGYMVCDL